MGKVTLKDILDINCPPEKRFIKELAEVKAITDQAKASGFTIGIVGGVWDMLHVGHAKYLALAKERCNILVTIVDSDELVKHRKGPTRPIVPEEERVQMVCHLRTSSIVMLRNLKDHLRDLEYISSALLPDVCILSTSTGDIPPEQREVMKQFIKEIVIFPPQAETTTSARIRHLAIDASKPLGEAVASVVGRHVENFTKVAEELVADLGQTISQHMDRVGK